MERRSDGKKLYTNGKTTAWCTEGEQPDGCTLAVYSDKQKVSALTGVHGDLIICTAQWAANKYTIAYNKNSGKGSMSNTTAYYGKKVALRANTFTRSGYKFAGWTVYRKSDKTYLYSSVDETATGWYQKNKQPSGWVNYVYLDKANVLNLTATNGDTITMYAYWSDVAVANETISTDSTLAYTLKGLVTPRAVQNFCITDEYVYITQRVVSSTYISRLKKNDKNKTAVFMDYMEIVNGGHGQALDAYTYNGKEYLYMACRAETYSEEKYFSLEAARFVYEPNVTYDYTDLNRFVDMNYANPSGKKLGTTYRVAVGCNDDYTIFRVQTREGSITYSTYDTAKINKLLDNSHTVSMNTSAVRSACIKSFTQSGVTIVRPNNSFQGVDILDDDKLFITGGVDGQLPMMACMSDTGHFNKLIKMAGVGTCEIEGVQCRDNNLYFLVIPDITTKADSQQIRYIPDALGIN